MQSSGMASLYKSISDDNRANNDQPSNNALTGAIANCPADLKAIFVGNSPYLLANLEDKHRHRLCLQHAERLSVGGSHHDALWPLPLQQ